MAGVRLGQFKMGDVWPPLCAILGFLGGSFIATWIASISTSKHIHRILFLLIAVLIACAEASSPHGIEITLVSIALLSFPMGMMNPVLSKVGAEPVSLTFMTGTLNRIGSHLASFVAGKTLSDPIDPSDNHLRRAGIDLSIWLGFLLGAALGGIFVPRLHHLALVPVIVIMLLMALFSKQEAQ